MLSKPTIIDYWVDGKQVISQIKLIDKTKSGKGGRPRKNLMKKNYNHDTLYSRLQITITAIVKRRVHHIDDVDSYFSCITGICI